MCRAVGDGAGLEVLHSIAEGGELWGSRVAEEAVLGPGRPPLVVIIPT